MLYRTLVLGSALATTNALQIDSLPVRNDIVSRRQSFGAIAAFGLAVPAAFADDEYISPARAKILAAKEAELAKKGPSKVQAVADSSAQGRSGKAQSAQMMQKKIAKQQEQEKIAYNELRREAAASAQASLELPSLPSLPSVSLPSLPF